MFFPISPVSMGYETLLTERFFFLSFHSVCEAMWQRSKWNAAASRSETRFNFYKTTFVKIQNDIDCIDSFEKKPSETLLYFLNTPFIPTNIRTEISRIDFIRLRLYKRSHRFLTFESGENQFYGLQCAAARLIPEVKMEELEERSISALTPSVGGV